MPLPYAVLARKGEAPSSSPQQTIGTFHFYEAEGSSDRILELFTLELAWNNNRPFHSSIPSGRYKVVPAHWSKYSKEGDYFAYQVLDVLMRDSIMFHYGNFYTNTDGCILPGLDIYDLNSDGLIDVKRSKDAIRAMNNIAPDGFDLNIIDQRTGINSVDEIVVPDLSE